MDFLKKDFLETLSVEYNDEEQEIIISGSPLSVEAIFATFPEFYQRAFNIWKYDDWLPVILGRLETILQLYGNRKRFRELVEAIKNNKIIPFIGSGMSVPSDVPTWKDFLRSLRQYSQLDEGELENFLINGLYEEAANALLSTMDPSIFNDEIERHCLLRNNDPINGSIRYVPSLFQSSVITTNFDNVLELLFESRRKKFDHILEGTSIKHYRRRDSKGDKCLLKIHGEYWKPETRVLTTDEYRRFYALDSDTRKEFCLIIQRQSFLFLGCSLSTDKTMQLMYDMTKTDPYAHNHYAFLRDPGDDKKRLLRESFLAERKIVPIWYQGDPDENIEALLVGLLNETKKIDDNKEN